MNFNINDFFYSWADNEGSVNSTDSILSWVEERNKNVFVDIKKISPDLKNGFWYYNEYSGELVNKNNSFFSVKGVEIFKNGELYCSQPVIAQNEIGYLGIICKKINGVINFLMQAKIEPGNVNKIQISPTIQATKSNFEQKHGGKRPAYVEYFINADRYCIVVDQLQSEQSSRFIKKRNRNIIILLPENEEIEVLDSHKWMTLGQLKQLMKYDNLVNMDTRTVISCIPFYSIRDNEDNTDSYFSDISFYNSIKDINPKEISDIYNYVNDYKMYNNDEIKIVPLMLLPDWSMKENEFACDNLYSFKMVFCDIAIEGREVAKWQQPLFEAIGKATFGMFTCVENNIRKFLVKGKSEFGCFDKIEIGPAIQIEATTLPEDFDVVEKMFFEKYIDKCGILYDVVLSEEGGRFYHEQNKNIIIEINKNDIAQLPKGYFWASYGTLNMLSQVNNSLNIQLRNLMSLLEV